MMNNTYPKESGIYCFKNVKNNKVYIGQSVNLNQRIKQHLRDLRANRDYSTALLNAWNKYTEEFFEITILEICTKDKLDEREIFYISKFKSNKKEFGYNISSGGGVMRGENSPMFGKRLSLESLEKMKASRVKRIRTTEERKSVSDKLKGHVVTNETRQKISKSQTGKKRKPLSEEHKEKIKQGNLGKKVSQKSIEKMRYSKIGYKSNKTKQTTSNFKGVCRDSYKCKKKSKEQSWVAQVTIDGKNKKIGRFETEIQAAVAFDNFVWEQFHDINKLNFPELKTI